MPYCPNCGAETEEDTSFCTKCGASLKEEKITSFSKSKVNKKFEKEEKRGISGKQEDGPIGPLVGGFILIAIGILTYLKVTGLLEEKTVWSAFLILIGALMIIVAVILVIFASRKHTKSY